MIKIEVKLLIDCHALSDDHEEVTSESQKTRLTSASRILDSVWGALTPPVADRYSWQGSPALVGGVAGLAIRAAMNDQSI